MKYYKIEPIKDSEQSIFPGFKLNHLDVSEPTVVGVYDAYGGIGVVGRGRFYWDGTQRHPLKNLDEFCDCIEGLILQQKREETINKIIG
jgi:hypothetical protein